MAMTDLERLEWDILRLINEARANPQKALEDRGLGAKYDPAKYPPRRPLRMNIALRGAAQEHAQRMADRGGLPEHTIDGVNDLNEGADAYQEQFGVRPLMWAVAHQHGGFSSESDAERTVKGWLTSDTGHRDYILGYTLDWSGVYRDTFLIGLGARWADSGDLYVDGLIGNGTTGFVDLYVRDNNADTGLVPTTGVTFESPDIHLYKDAARSEERLNPEYGEDNYVFVTVHNAGTKASNQFTVELYWADPGTNLLFPDAWHADGISSATNGNAIAGSGVPPNEGALDIGPFVWRPPSPETLVRGDGHFCLFARVLSDEDPIMHETNVLEREYENNLAQLNVTVVDEIGNGEDSFPIIIGPGGSQVDVKLDPGQLPQDGGKVYLRLRSRFLEGAKLRGIKVSETTPGGQITTLVCKSSGPYILENLQFAKGEVCEAELQLRLPAKGKEGATYPVRVTQTIDGRPVGAVTVVARYFTNPTYIGNKSTGELHLPSCQWVGRMSPRNKKPLSDFDAAHKKGYDNCATCLGGSKR
ncbi:MAG: hypothetical protein HY741_10685 [Chloroflexi bacterium]|nr:hypothetical protein [Chloroflexota bacterium]